MLKHGEYIAPSLLEADDTPPPKVDGNALNGVKKRYQKHVPASDKPSAFGNIQAIYKDAIQFVEATTSAQMRGLGLIGVLIYVGSTCFLVYKIATETAYLVAHDQYDAFDALFDALLCFFLFVIARPWFVAAWQLDAFSSQDQPTIFDRKRRKVYRLLAPHKQGGPWWKPLSASHLQAIEYDWEHITAEHRVAFMTTGKAARQMHSLTMVVRDQAKTGEPHGRLLDEFSVGNNMALGPNTVDMLWEHIRRFMEEGGPGLRDGETLQVFERPKTLWQSMGVVSPFGPKFGWWWKTSKPIVMLMIVMLPVSLPFFTLWGVCNWISHKTMRKTVWPDEMQTLLGTPIKGTAQD